jgi:hypothetical protein
MSFLFFDYVIASRKKAIDHNSTRHNSYEYMVALNHNTTKQPNLVALNFYGGS